jgi:hypothetical protein
MDLQEFAVSALAAAVQLLGRMAQDLQQSPAFPELFQPAAAALDRLAAVTAAHDVSHRTHIRTWGTCLSNHIAVGSRPHRHQGRASTAWFTLS